MRQRARWLGLALASLVAAVLAYAVLVHTRPGQLLDAEVWSAILDSTPTPIAEALAALARPLIFYVLVPLVATLVLLALARGRWAAAMAATLVAATPTPAALYLRENVLTRPDLGVRGYDHNTFPSTHAAAAFGLLVALILVWPGPVDRRDAGRVAFVAALVLLGNVTSYAHRPADVLGSLLLVGAVAFLAVAALGFRPATPRRPRVRQRSVPT
ncbi:MAG: phosphatase PAP2 family protein [Brachybacterium paraconglomeratum]|nr:phosphatase PAP2 family protein [Brachybacterium paraconglomeratum]